MMSYDIESFVCLRHCMDNVATTLKKLWVSFFFFFLRKKKTSFWCSTILHRERNNFSFRGYDFLVADAVKALSCYAMMMDHVLGR